MELSDKARDTKLMGLEFREVQKMGKGWTTGVGIQNSYEWKS